MKKYFFVLSVLFLLAVTSLETNACTNYLVTKGASIDGSTMITYAADSHIRYGELYWREAGEWPEGTMVTLYDRGTAKPLGQIPQAPKTYQVIGFMNEMQVAIGETTYGGRHELMDSLAIVDYGSLMFLAMQRSSSAREAIKVIMELVNKYGYASSGESFSIADKNEVWIMEMISKGCETVWDKKQKKYINKDKGAVWVAVRIPDGYISAHANQSRITTFDLSNGKNSISSTEIDRFFDPEIDVIYAEDVISFARKKGYFEGDDKDFSFSAAYAPISFGGARFCELRVWAMFNDVNDDMQQYWEQACGNDLDSRMPLYIKPNRKLGPLDLMKFKRNYLQGTELDMSKDAGAGEFERPYRWRPLTWQYDSVKYCNERVTATQQTGFSFIAQMRSWLPDPIGGVYWFGVDDAGSTVYVPFYCGINNTPDKWAEGYGDILTYKDDAAFWVFNRVAHIAYLFYNRVMVDVREHQSKLENKFVNYQPKVDAAALEFYNDNPAKAKEFLTDYSVNTANYVIEYWSDLGDFLFVKYLDGNVKQEENGEFLRNPWGYPRPPKFPGYSDEWKKTVVEKTGGQFKMK